MGVTGRGSRACAVGHKGVAVFTKKNVQGRDERW